MVGRGYTVGGQAGLPYACVGDDRWVVPLFSATGVSRQRYGRHPCEVPRPLHTIPL